MYEKNLENIRQIWKQGKIPVLYRKGKGHPLFVKLPYKEGNKEWLQNGRRNKPKWLPEKRYWEIPKAWFNDTVNRGLIRWEKLYIIQPHAAHEICARACWEAEGHECECSCLGEHHGSERPSGRWFEITDTFAVKYESSELACRLLIRK